MKKKLIGVFLLMSLVCGSISAQGLPDRKETLETLIKVNNYFMKKYADYRTPLIMVLFVPAISGQGECTMKD